MVCKGNNVKKFLSLGPTPLANSLLTEGDLTKGELFFPLDIYFCLNCNHVGLVDIVPPELMFKNYFYMTSMSQTMLNNLRNLCQNIAEKYIQGKPNAFVIDVGSNDGSLLRIFQSLGFTNTLGVEPSNVALIAQGNGIQTLNEFFNVQTANKIVKDFGKASVITATNVFAHVADLDGFMQGVANLLEDNGVFVFENAYLVDLLNHIEFDTMYHEHLCYYGVRPLQRLFGRFGLELVDVQRLPIHGGSIRGFVKKKDMSPVSENVKSLVKLETDMRLDSLETYFEFAAKVKNIRRKLIELVESLKSQDKRIVGYGATAKGTTLLNYCGIGVDTIDYIVDSTPLKQNRYYPGVHIPIRNPDVIKKDKPDYILLLAWNFAKEIMEKEKWFLESGGKFIVPVPEPFVVDSLQKLEHIQGTIGR
jgi:hypothetical protein